MVDERKDVVSAVIFVLINLLNYIDRYTIAGVLTQVQAYYNIDDTVAGLIQTVFLVFFMLCSPICGYFGDRFNRKFIVLIGVLVWLVAVIGSSFVPSNHFWLFMLFRGIVGVGEATYSTVAPTMISDMFSTKYRSLVYMIFYFAIPVGSGVGYITGSVMASITGQWQWGVRLPSLAGLVVLVIAFFLLYEPVRGAAEESKTLGKKSGNYWQDIKSLMTIPTYIICSWAYTCMVFVTGTLAWWAPTIIEHSMAWSHELQKTDDLTKREKTSVGLIFGAVTLVAGIVGVGAGFLLSSWISKGTGCFRVMKTNKAPLLVSTLGAILATPCLLVGLLFGHKVMALQYTFFFFAITFSCFNWGLNIDVLCTVVLPHRRSTAFGYFTLLSHLCGDATGPIIIGKISDVLRKGSNTPKDQYLSLAHASLVCVGVLVLSAVLYFLSSLTLVRDQNKFRQELAQDDSTAKSMKGSTDSLEKRSNSSDEDCV